MEKEETLIRKALEAAGQEILKAQPADGVVTKEGRANFVTAADLASEKIIMELIREAFPNDLILSEETDSNIANPLSVDRLWVIDPIDGTSNFRFGRNYSAISIGLVQNGRTVAAGVYDPFNDDLFFALKGQGATLNSKAIAVSSVEDLSQTTVACDNSYEADGTKRNLELMLKVQPTPWYMMRGSAVLAMCDAAAGRVDAYMHTALKPWDNAAAFLIAEEAGAIILGIDGRPVSFLSEHVVIGNEALTKKLLDAINS